MRTHHCCWLLSSKGNGQQALPCCLKPAVSDAYADSVRACSQLMGCVYVDRATAQSKHKVGRFLCVFAPQGLHFAS